MVCSMSWRGGRFNPPCDLGPESLRIQLWRAVLVHLGVSLSLCIHLGQMLTCFAPSTLQRRTPSARLVRRGRHPRVHFVDASRSLRRSEARRSCTCTRVGRCGGDLDSTVCQPLFSVRKAEDADNIRRRSLIPGAITETCWLAAGLAIASQDQVFFYSPELEDDDDVHRLARRRIAPLPLHHPQLLFQALLQGTECITSTSPDHLYLLFSC